MFELVCTVRNCGLPLELSDGLRCPSGHHFDRAKPGYWNLTQPQDKKSSNPGDSEDAVDARSKWLARGYGQGIIDALRPWLLANGSQAADQPAGEAGSLQTCRVVDLGCGEGTFGDALFDRESYSYCGIDLSKSAIKRAASRFKHLTWVLANADRFLPADSDSVDLVISLFGRRPIEEIARVLKASGACIVAVPGADDLLELRAVAQQHGRQRSRWESIEVEFRSQGLVLAERKNWKHAVQLSKQAATEAMAMTYRGVRTSQQQRLDELPDETEVTLEADLLLFQKVTS